jgi:hypothetical protein
MGEPGAVIISFMVDEDLGLVLEAAKGGAVDNAVAIPLVGRSLILENLVVTAPKTSAAAGGVGGEIGSFHGVSENSLS